MTTALLPATFDPITSGHLDIIKRSATIFERLVVAVFATPAKDALYPLEERLSMVRESIPQGQGIEVVPFDGLVVNLARRVGARVLVRGLRNVIDFEYEFQQAGLNQKMMPELEVVCLLAKGESGLLSSTLVKEIAANGGDVTDLVPSPVVQRLAVTFS